jgi:RNA-directed DNA polymerase
VPERATAPRSRRWSEWSAEAVVARCASAGMATRLLEAERAANSEGPNDEESEALVSLDKAQHQKSAVQAELPLGTRGEAPKAQRSGDASSAAIEHARSGTEHLLERVLERRNLERALKRVRQNKGKPGIDGMTVDDLRAHLKEHWLDLREKLLAGTYQPLPVREVEIPKRSGGVRKLGIPTVLDRFLQQAILQVIQPIFDPTFSEHSHGFRPGRSAHGAVCEAQRYIQSGKRVVVDVDLEKFFDRVNHDVLMGRLEKRIGDKRMLGLIRRYLDAGIMANGVVMERHEGTPQGGPLSPLLANVLLDEVDRELEKRGLCFVRYADDLNVYVGSWRAGEDAFEMLREQYAALRLKINDEKSAVGRPWDRKFLGFSFWVAPGKTVKRRVAAAALGTLKQKIRQITDRNGGRSMKSVFEELRGYLQGWKQYYQLAETPRIFRGLDEWIRHRLRMVQLKQWKRGTTIYRELKRLGASEDAARLAASLAERWWSNAGKLLNTALPTSHYDREGVPRLV